VCKFYQGAEDKELERQLKLLFKSVHREKPESSRSVSILLDGISKFANDARNRKKRTLWHCGERMTRA
jgi:23S rRNA U2552 (ribose-2'-O)-methylase RlmE/FtsJ